MARCGRIQLSHDLIIGLKNTQNNCCVMQSDRSCLFTCCCQVAVVRLILGVSGVVDPIQFLEMLSKQLGVTKQITFVRLRDLMAFRTRLGLQLDRALRRSQYVAATNLVTLTPALCLGRVEFHFIS